jgi:hypothetical protein
LGSHLFEKSSQGRFGALLSHPQQSASAGINLVNQRQEAIGSLPFAPVDFIDAEGFNAHQRAVCQSPFHDPFDRATDIVPTGQKLHVGFGLKLIEQLNDLRLLEAIIAQELTHMSPVLFFRFFLHSFKNSFKRVNRLDVDSNEDENP